MQKSYSEIFQSFPRLSKTVLNSATFRNKYSDFKVIEDLGFEPDGQGEHLFLQIRKSGRNTAEVAERLARQAGIKALDVGYSGMKDKHAVTRQWFSLHLPGKGDLQISDEEGMEILHHSRHNKKLRRGTHKGNTFEITLRDCTGEQAEWQIRLEKINAYGFPNYFAEQRFGRGFSNLNRAEKLFGEPKFRAKRQQRSLYLSAARSWLFNQVCAARLTAGNWDGAVNGELYILEGSRSFFSADDSETEKLRYEAKDIHPSGPLWGRHKTQQDPLYHYELSLLHNDEIFRLGLEQAGLKLERRALRALAHNLQWQWLDDSSLKLTFFLNKGCFATSLLRELTELKAGEFS